MHQPSRSVPAADTQRHARCLSALRRIAWDTERDLIRSRQPDFGRRFVPDSLSRVGELGFLLPHQARALSQLQACTYAQCAVRVGRCVAVVMLNASERHWCGDAVVLQAHLRVADDSLKHQALFRRLALMTALRLPQGYAFSAGEDALARSALRRGRWATLGLALALVLAVQAHYRHSLVAAGLCPLWQDVFLFHWKEASQHAVLIELGWCDEHARCDAGQRELAAMQFADLIDDLAVGVQRQAEADMEFFARHLTPGLGVGERDELLRLLCRAYRHQFIGSGLLEPRFVNALQALVPAGVRQQMSARLAPWTSQT